MKTIDQWLIRTAQNDLAGPYTQEQLVGMIREGRLSSQDEVCPASGYWIYLHESEEVAQFLGISLPQPERASDEEITETQTERLELAEEPVAKSAGEEKVLELAESADPGTEETAMISNRALRQFQPKKKTASNQKKPRTHPSEVAKFVAQVTNLRIPVSFGKAVVIGKIERPVVRRGLMLLLILACVVAVLVWVRS